MSNLEEFKIDNIKTSWDLEKYFYSSLKDKNLIEDIENIEKKVLKFKKKYENRIKELSPKQLVEFFEDEQELDFSVNKPILYIFLKKSLNLIDEEIILLDEKLNFIFTNVGNYLLFVQEEFKDIGKKKLLELSKKDELRNYKKILIEKVDSLKFLLSSKEEYILNIKQANSSSFISLYDEFNASFKFKFKENNKIKLLTREEISKFILSPNQELRKKAKESIYENFSNQKSQIVLSKLYMLIVRDWINEKNLRGYKTPISIRNFMEDLEDKTVDNLINQVETNYFLYHNYLKLKKKILNLKVLNSYDLYAPFSTKKKDISFTSAVKIYLGIIKDFDIEFFNYSIDMLENSRVDVFTKQNKQNGAFALYEKNYESFVLLNFTNTNRDLLTLAHEFGHAIHGKLSQKQNSQNFQSPLNLAETASIFNETLVFDSLLKNTKSKQEEIEMITSKLEDLFATIFRQIQYIKFEKRVHKIVEGGGFLTSRELNILWRKEQIKLTSNIVKYLKKSEDESLWSSIPHIFHTPFYCYTYSFGNILSLNLYENYKKQGKSFIKNYKEILSSGGSEKTFDLLLKYGIDINSEKFYEVAFSYIKDLIKRLESITK